MEASFWTSKSWQILICLSLHNDIPSHSARLPCLFRHGPSTETFWLRIISCRKIPVSVQQFPPIASKLSRQVSTFFWKILGCQWLELLNEWFNGEIFTKYFYSQAAVKWHRFCLPVRIANNHIGSNRSLTPIIGTLDLLGVGLYYGAYIMGPILELLYNIYQNCRYTKKTILSLSVIFRFCKSAQGTNPGLVWLPDISFNTECPKPQRTSMPTWRLFTSSTLVAYPQHQQVGSWWDQWSEMKPIHPELV